MVDRAATGIVRAGRAGEPSGEASGATRDASVLVGGSTVAAGQAGEAARRVDRTVSWGKDSWGRLTFFFSFSFPLLIVFFMVVYFFK